MTEMIAIPGGRVSLRDERIERVWSVDVEPFWLGRCTVTREGSQLPLVDLSWRDAIAYCNMRSTAEGLTPCYRVGADVEWDRSADGYRLPTEAEWEFACRAGDERVRYGDIDDIAWYRDNSEDRVHEVGQKAPNAFGLHDMIGNVWEWCWDVYDPDVYGTYRVFRGGGFSDRAWSCTAAGRRRSHPTFHIDDLGFRLARNRV